MLAIIFIFTSLWEHFTRKKEDRWFKKVDDLYIYFPKRQKKTVNPALEQTSEKIIEESATTKEINKN